MMVKAKAVEPQIALWRQGISFFGTTAKPTTGRDGQRLCITTGTARHTDTERGSPLGLKDEGIPTPI